VYFSFLYIRRIAIVYLSPFGLCLKEDFKNPSFDCPAPNDYDLSKYPYEFAFDSLNYHFCYFKFIRFIFYKFLLILIDKNVLLSSELVSNLLEFSKQNFTKLSD